MCLKIKMNNKKKCVLLSGVCHRGLKGMLCDALFFLFFLVLTFHFFPYGTNKGGRGFKPLSLFTLLMSLYPSMH